MGKKQDSCMRITLSIFMISEFKLYFYLLQLNLQYQLMFKKRNIKKEQLNLSQIKQDDDLQINGQSKKKVKIQKPQVKSTIGGSTSTRKNQNQQATHRQFQSLSYKKGIKITNTEQILAGDDAINHETEEAKKKYLQNIQMTKKIKEGKLSTKIYRGTNAYANYKLTESQLQNPLENYSWKHGPTRNNNTSTKNTCRFDYDPSLCKDWHDSGYCVFGNSCIYLHDRSNYKNGWQLEKDFEKSQRQRWKRIMNPDASEQSQYIQDLQKYKPQQTCKYCNESLKEPVQISCLHIFCKKCANQLFDKNEKCPDCKKKLNGIMNNAQKTINNQKQTYEQMLANAKKNHQMSKIKKAKYKDCNSLDVFAAQ